MSETSGLWAVISATCSIGRTRPAEICEAELCIGRYIYSCTLYLTDIIIFYIIDTTHNDKSSWARIDVYGLKTLLSCSGLERESSDWLRSVIQDSLQNGLLGNTRIYRDKLIIHWINGIVQSQSSLRQPCYKPWMLQDLYT